MNHEGIKFSLVSRELIADSIEAIVHGLAYDGLVGFGGCDKTLPDIEAEADCQIGALTHTIRQSSENLAALVDRKPDDQYPALGFGEQFAQHDTGVACR